MQFFRPIVQAFEAPRFPQDHSKKPRLADFREPAQIAVRRGLKCYSSPEEVAPLKLRLLFAVVLFASGFSPARGQTLTVTPSRVLSDESATIRAGGLPPNEKITLRAELVDGADHHWESQAEFLADAQGTVDASQQAPVKGSYEGVSAMGLVWSMKPAEKNVDTYQAPRDLGVQAIDFQVIVNDKQAATARLEQLSVADGVRQIKVEGQLHGVLFVPASDGPHPGVLVVGGSEGGVPRQRGAWLASHSYAALALAYFRYDDLPPELAAIPLEYFGSALTWMMQRPEILPDHIGVLGISRGGELALQLGSMYPEIKAVVAYVPANVRYPACCGGTRVPYAWTWKGEPLSYVPQRSLRNPEAVMKSHAQIAVERTHGPILLISGEDDGVWESSVMANAIVGQLRSAHFSFPVEHLKYPHAGHRAGRPEIVPAWGDRAIQPVSGREMNMGGTPAGNAKSSLDAIPKVLEFLRQSLAAPVPPK
jgi:dienelactone hydrolase